MNKKSNKKLMAGLIALITLIIIGITCSGFLNNFKEGIKFLGISFGISAGLVLLLFIMKYIIKGADKLVGEGRTFNDRAIVLFSILILVSLTCRGFLKNFTLGIVFLIVSIAFVAITFLIMYGINSKKGAIKKAILAEKTSGEKMFILLTVLILVSLTCGGFIQNLKAGILFLIISIISSLALYLTVTEVKNENSIIGKIIRIETTFNQKMMILLSTIIMVSLTCGGFLRNLRAGIVFLMISIVFTTSMLMLVLGVKSKHKIYDKIAGFETNFNEKMIILLTTMAMVSITSGGFLYNFKLGMLFLTISLIFSGLVLAGVISVRPRVNIFKMRARIQNLGKKEAIRAFGMIFACIFVVFNLSGTWAYFNINNSEHEVTKTIAKLDVHYNDNTSMLGGGIEGEEDTIDYVNIYIDNSKILAKSMCINYKNSDNSSYVERKMKYVLPNPVLNGKQLEGNWQMYSIPRNEFINNGDFFGKYKFTDPYNGYGELLLGSKVLAANAKNIYVFVTDKDTVEKIVTVTIDGQVIDSSSGASTITNTLTVYFENSWNWSNMYFYAWNKTTDNKTIVFGKSWPGSSVSKSSSEVTDEKGNKWIKYTYYNFSAEKGQRYIIVSVNNEGKIGQTQTEDLQVDNNWNEVYVYGKVNNNKVQWKITNNNPY